MIRTVYIASVLGIVMFFIALGPGIAWGIAIGTSGPLVLASSFGAVGAGLLIGLIGFGLGLLFFRKPGATTEEVEAMAEAATSADSKERIEAARY